MRTVLVLNLWLAVVCGSDARAAGMPQANAGGRLVVTVFDPLQAVIPNARVTLTREDDEWTPEPVRTALTSGAGAAAFVRLAPGRYTIRAEFAGFQPVTLSGQRLKTGESRRSITLPIEKLDESVTVAPDQQSAALDPKGTAFAAVLTRDQIDALPDDPDEAEQMLRAMAPPGATFRIDGFSGGKLPPKSQIRSVRIPRMEMMAAQDHGGLGGATHIEVVTRPAQGPLEGNLDAGFRNSALTAASPFAPAKGDAGLRRYGVAVSRAILPNRLSFSAAARGTAKYDSAYLLASVPTGVRAEALRQPLETVTFLGRLDQMVTPDHALRLSVERTRSTRENLGIGGFDLPERGYTTEATDTIVRLSEDGPMGRRMFLGSRVQLRWTDSSSRSLTESPTLRVLDAFTSGGAQRAGGSQAIDVEAAGDLDYVRGRHSARAGLLLEGGRYRTGDRANYLGTFTFSSVTDYQAGRPALYTRRVGDPDARFADVRLGLYLQDDFRLSKSLLLSYGLRHEIQALGVSRGALSPRVAATWSPGTSGRTTVRAGWGWFSDWVAASSYGQTLQLGGSSQREISLVVPSYPVPETDAASPTLPVNRYLLAPNLGLPRSMAVTVGVDQRLATGVRGSIAYSYRRGFALLRGRNLNGPLDGVRPNAAFANVVEAAADAASRAHAVNAGVSVSLPGVSRTQLSANYSFTRAKSNTAGDFEVPVCSSPPALEWASIAPAHRLTVTANSSLWRTLALNLYLRVQSGTPYNITTGRDDNLDGLFNDRPAGLPRNAAMTPGLWDLAGSLTYTLAFGSRRSAPGVQEVMVIAGGSGSGGIPAAAVRANSTASRYQLQLYASAHNLTNHDNESGYSGVMTSPFFRRPTAVLNPREVEMGVRFRF